MSKIEMGVAPTQQQLKFAYIAINASRNAFFWLDSKGQVVEVNDYACVSLGYSREELIGLHVWDFDPNVPANIWASACAESKQKRPSTFESNHRRKDGTVFPVEITGDIVNVDGEDYFFTIVIDITERKATEQALADSRRLLQTIIDTAPLSIFWKDRDLRYMGCNPTFAAGIGLSGSIELIGKDDYQMRWSNYADAIRNDDRSVMESGIPKLAHEDTFVTHDGRRIWLRISKIPLRNQENEIIGVLGISEDITPEVAARNELKKSNEFFQRMFDNSPVGISIADLNGFYLAANAAMCLMLGYSEEEMKRMSYRDVTHPEDLSENNLKRERLVEGEQDTFRMEKRYVRKDGSIVWTLMVVTSIKGPDGKTLVTIGQSLNINQQKLVEVELIKSEANLRSMMDNSPYLSWLKDVEGRYTAVNKVFVKFLQLEDARQVIGKTDWDLVPSELAQKYRADDVEVMALRQNKHVEETAFDGNNFHFLEAYKTPIIDAQGNVLGTVGFAKDITQLKKHEQEIIHSREQLRELATYHQRILEEERKHIAREIHDELGQQLSAMKMDIGFLRRNHGDIPDILKLAHQMRDAVDTSINVVRHVASNLRPAALDHGIIAAIEWLAREFASRSGIDCEFLYQGEDIFLGEAQSIVLYRVAQESLTNVKRYAKATHVDINLSHQGDEICLLVSDNGQGFDVTAAETKGSYGLLGMRERVHSLRGAIDINSALGKGTTILITIPKKQS